MSRLAAFVMYLALALSLGLGSVAHAAENVICVDVSADSISTHVDGDSDQVPADAEKGYPHHHGSCHSHHIGIPIKVSSVESSYIAREPLRPFDNSRVARAPADPALRPPIA